MSHEETVANQGATHVNRDLKSCGGTSMWVGMGVDAERSDGG